MQVETFKFNIVRKNINRKLCPRNHDGESQELLRRYKLQQDNLTYHHQNDSTKETQRGVQEGVTIGIVSRIGKGQLRLAKDFDKADKHHDTGA